MLLHSILHWPEVADLYLWPFTLDHTIFLWNNMPHCDTRLAPIKVFTSTKFQNYKHLEMCHVWGSPIFVLDLALQDVKNIPRWNPRSRLGMFFGNSPVQSSTVARVLNLRTGYTTAQYHTVHDDLFSTVHNDGTALGLLTPEFWNGRLHTGLEDNIVAEYDLAGNLIPPPPLQDEWLNGQEHQVRDEARTRRRQRRTQTVPLQNSNAPDPDLVQGIQPLFPPTLADATSTGQLPTVPEGVDPGQDQDDVAITENSETDASEGAQQRTRSYRRVRPPNRMNLKTRIKFKGDNLRQYENGRNPEQKVRAGLLNEQLIQGLNWNRLVDSLKTESVGKVMAQMNTETDQDLNTVEECNPALLISKASEDDNPTYEQAMSGPHKEVYWQAAKKKVDTLVKKVSWEVVAKKAWMHVLPSTWAFECKRFPDGIIRKLKARFCARGDRQIEGLNFFETFAPVVAWETIRIMLILSIIFDLATLQVDYTAAFVHADIDKPPNWDTMTELEKERSGVYIEIPRGFGEDGKVLKLKKSLYGLKQSPRNFVLHRKGKLDKVGFTQS
jgi:hypothetical protein